jgi:anti-sigma-K factor RskA
MSGTMSGAGDMEREPEGDDLLAAEYVLGVQDAQARRELEQRIEQSRDFARLVDRWEVHFAPLAAEFAEVTAPAGIKERIDRLLFSASSRAAPAQKAGFWNSLAVWRALTLAAFACLAIVVALPMIRPQPAVEPHRMVASLAAEGSDVHYMAFYDAATQQVSLSHMTGERAEGRDFELWMIEGQNPPVSLGVVPVGATVQITMTEDLARRLTSGSVIAISLEPAGGSPTGQPTGPVVAAGGLTNI